MFFWIDDWRYEAVPLAGHCLYESRCVGVVLQDLTKLADRPPDAVIGVQEGAFAPDLGDNLIPSDNFARALEQQNQDFQWDTFQFSR